MPDRDKDPNKWKDIFRAAAEKFGVPQALLERVAEVESTWNPQAVSPAGAMGLMQISPKDHPEVKDPFNPAEAIPYAASYLSQLHGRFGSWDLALAAYNGGQTRLNRRGRDISQMPQETRNYVTKVLSAIDLPGPEEPRGLDREIMGRVEDMRALPDASRVRLEQQLSHEPAREESVGFLSYVLDRVTSPPPGFQALMKGETPLDRQIRGVGQDLLSKVPPLPGPLQQVVDLVESPAGVALGATGPFAAGQLGRAAGTAAKAARTSTQLADPFRSTAESVRSASSPLDPSSLVGRPINPSTLPPPQRQAEIDRITRGTRTVQIGDITAEQYTNVTKAPFYTTSPDKVNWGEAVKKEPIKTVLGEWGREAFRGGSDVTISLANKFPKVTGLATGPWGYSPNGVIRVFNSPDISKTEQNLSFLHEYGHHIDGRIFLFLKEKGVSEVGPVRLGDIRFASAHAGVDNSFRTAVDVAAKSIARSKPMRAHIAQDIDRVRGAYPRMGGYLADFFGSITSQMGKDRVGYGHSLSYYVKFPDAMYVEPFAELFQFKHLPPREDSLGDVAQFSEMIIKRYVPEVVEAFENILALALKLK